MPRKWQAQALTAAEPATAPLLTAAQPAVLVSGATEILASVSPAIAMKATSAPEAVASELLEHEGVSIHRLVVGRGAVAGGLQDDPTVLFDEEIPSLVLILGLRGSEEGNQRRG